MEVVCCKLPRREHDDDDAHCCECEDTGEVRVRAIVLACLLARPAPRSPSSRLHLTTTDKSTLDALLSTSSAPLHILPPLFHIYTRHCHIHFLSPIYASP